jgi:hypothetical protein
MSEEQIRQKLKAIENTEKGKEKNREEIEEMLKTLRTPKKLEQHHMRIIANLLELVFTEKQDLEDGLFTLWKQELGTELGLLKIEKAVEQLKRTTDWSEQNR